MDVGKGREQERKLFRRSDCRKRPPWLTPGGLIPAYIQVNVRAQISSFPRSGVGMQIRTLCVVLQNKKNNYAN
jgi:hypothetical protein